MAFYSGQVSVGTVATVIDGTLVGAAGGNPYKMHINNNDNTTDVFIGGSAVTTTTGYRLEKLEAMNLMVSPTDRLYAVSSKEGHILSWLTEPV